MKVLMAKIYGFCPGVKRAIEMARNCKLQIANDKLFVLKEIVHNPLVVADLGIKSVQSLEKVPEGSTVIFSSHGVAPAVFNQAKRKRLTIIDATCPLVTKVHALVKNFSRQGYEILYLGDKGHDEVLGVIGEAPTKIKVIHSIEEAKNLKTKKQDKLVVLTQTTLSLDDTQEIVDLLKKKFPKILVFNTICQATTERQQAVRELAKKVDLVIVVGGKNSANSKRLKEVAEKSGIKAYQIERVEELEKISLKGVKTVGLTAGASTPDWVIKEVANKLKYL